MSQAAIPKISGGRPPIFPPMSTGFDSGPDDSGDPMHRRIAESVDRLIRTIDATPIENLPTTLELLFQRKRWVEEEIAAARLIDATVLPPSFLGLSFWDIGPDDEIVSFYQRLAHRLEDAIQRVKMRLWVLNEDVFTSER